MQSIRRLPREVQGVPLDIIAPEGGFELLIEWLSHRGSSTEVMLHVIDHRQRELFLGIQLKSSDTIASSRGQEVFIENCEVTVLDQYGNDTELQAQAWVSLNPEVKTAGLPAGKIIIWNPHYRKGMTSNASA